MGEKEAGRIELGSGGDGGGELAHNPFAALRSRGAETGVPSGGTASTSGSDAQAGPAAPVSDESAERGWLTSAPLVVRHERKGHGGKTVTVIDGSRVQAATAERWAQLARDLRKALGVGARADGSTVVVQGELVERVSRFLKDRFDARITQGTKP